MKISENKKTKGKNSITIEGDFNIYTVEEIKKNINKYLDDSANLEMDLSNIKKIDTAGFQLILFIKNEIEKNKKKLKITKPSEEVKAIFNTYGESI